MDRRKLAKEVLLILLGSMILAFGIFNLNYQNNITEGGVLGVLLLLKNMFGIELSVANLVIDTALLALAYKFFGKKFLIYSIIATISFSLFSEVFEFIGPVIPVLQSKLVGSVLSGLFVGVGVGIIVRTGAAAGGDDALALVISKITSLNIGKVYMITDMVILLLSLSYLSAYDVFWSVIAVNVSGRIIDFMYTFKSKKEATV